jgi:peptidoglycan/LPS O-acetylase OafA/YrhL
MFRVNILSEFDGERRNNFTLLRLIFACAVLFGHSYPITATGSDPLSAMIVPYPPIGSIAVDGFFAISGFLVTASFQNRGAFDFAISRVLRLYPAVLVYSLLAIFVVGPLAASVPLKTYFDANPLQNLWNAALWNWQYNLPYVFSSNHFAGATNGSTWTLPAELRCYLLVFFLGILGIFEKSYRANILLVGLLILVQGYNILPTFGFEDRALFPVASFLFGSLAWINRRFIPLNPIAAIIAAGMPFAIGRMISWWWFSPALEICLIYIVLVLAYQTKHIDVDRYGDMSYGTYIYAWPAQQLVWSLGQSGLTNALLAFSIVLPVAYLSWRLIEKPALGLRNKLVTKTRGQPSDPPLIVPAR